MLNISNSSENNIAWPHYDVLLNMLCKNIMHVSVRLLFDQNAKGESMQMLKMYVWYYMKSQVEGIALWDAVLHRLYCDV